MANLKQKTIKSFLWAFGERFGVQAMQLIAFVILARILSPDAFGLMGLIAIFITISQELVDSGFGLALIQSKSVDDIDYSSIFFINLIVSGSIFVVLFFIAPFIATFFAEPILVNLTRVLGLKFIISSFSIVQIARLTREVEFKKLMLAKVPSTIIGGAVGIAMAYYGFGVWSLIGQQLSDALAYSIQIWIQSSWKPMLVLNWGKVKKLFSYGSKLMVSGLLFASYRNMYELFLGKYYSTTQVGYYSQSDRVKQIPVLNISQVIARVSFPILSRFQDDDEKLKQSYKVLIRNVLLVIAPVMIGSIVIAEYLFRYVLTEKWVPAVPFFQILCIDGLLYPLHVYNLNVLKVKGRSDLYLKMETIRFTLSLIGLLSVAWYSVYAIVWMKILVGLITVVIFNRYCNKFIGYGLWEQFLDIKTILLGALIMGFCVNIFINVISLSDLEVLISSTILGAVIYLICIYTFERKLLIEVKNIINRKKENDF
tara:strand:- start:336501 stop:337949 length:1449 start_codon:yes stop_codon:yes gene_type:complete